MNRTATGTCVAAVLGFAVSLGAQSPTTTPSPTSQSARPMSSDRAAKDISVTGCLAKGSDGNFTLTNAHMDASGSASTTTADPSSPTAGSAATAGTTGTTSPAGSSSASAMGSTWMLMGGSDLDKHVGHKIQVTGKAADSMSSTGTTAGSTAGTTGTAGSTASSMPSASANHKLDVESVKMIAASCS